MSPPIAIARDSGGTVSAVRRRLWLSGYVLVAAAAIFYVPYLFPLSPSDSWSYTFGFNNQVAILLTLSLAGVGALWLRNSPLFRGTEETDSRLRPRTLLVGLTITLLACAAAYPLICSATPVADGAYFVDRIHKLAAGQRPYVDFEFAYGPLFLYPQLWIAQLLHIGIAHARYCFWVLNEIAGIFLLFQVIDGIDIPSRKKPAIFLLFCIASGSVFILGAVSYTFLRFALAPWLAFRVSRADEKGRNVFAPTALSYTVLLLISPEIALSFGVGSLAYLFLRGRLRSKLGWSGFFAMLAGMAAATFAAYRVHLLDTLLTFAGGNRDSPIIPSGFVLLFLLCIFLSILHFVRKVSQREIGTSVYLILISVPMILPALGSCDPLHVFYSGFGLLAVGLLCLSRSERSWEAAHLSFSVFFILLLFTSLVATRYSQYRAKLEHLIGHGAGSPHILQAEAFPGTHGALEAPFGFAAGGSDAYYAPWIVTGHFLGTLNAPLPRDAEIKEHELEEHPGRDVLVPDGCSHYRVLNGSAGRLWLEFEDSAPFWMPQRQSVNPYVRLCEYVDTHYHKVQAASSRSYGYEVWEPNRRSSGSGAGGRSPQG